MKVAAVSASLLLIAFLLSFSLSNGQTFQYSRGWTNGKRADPFSPYAAHTDAPWNSEDAVANFRQWELSRLLARLPPYGYRMYAYDFAPNTKVTPVAIASHLYQRPQVKHDAEPIASNEVSPGNANDLGDRYKRSTIEQDITG